MHDTDPGPTASSQQGTHPMKTYLASAVLLLVIACSLPTDVCGCSPAQAQGIVAGFVTRTDGTAVPNPEVRAEIRPFGCAQTGTVVSTHPAVAQSDASGRYRYEINMPFASDTACVRLVARAGGSAGGDSAVVDRVRLRFVYPTARPDSVRVDIQLP